MRLNLYPAIAMGLILLFLVAGLFREAINGAPEFIQVALLVLMVFIGIGAILLALWDTKVIGRK